MRQIVLDTETTGLEAELGHRIIEIGGVELLDRRLTGSHYHQYLNPERDIDEAAQEVHGISLDDLVDKPRFADIAEDFLDFVGGAELVIHNAPFDVGFLDAELARLGTGRRLADVCTVTDSLAIARNRHPGQKNNLDALCRRYGIDNSSRDLHGALLDAEILADVYLLLTGGQPTLFEDGESFDPSVVDLSRIVRVDGALDLPVHRASATELAAHATWLDKLDQPDQPAVWRKLLSD